MKTCLKFLCIYIINSLFIVFASTIFFFNLLFPLSLAELYLSLNQVNEAQSCVQETFQLFPHSVYVFYLVSVKILTVNFLLICFCFFVFFILEGGCKEAG